MKKLIFLFALLLVTIWFGIVIHQDPGYVLIAYKHATIEMTLWMALLMLILTILVVFILSLLLSKSSKMPGRIKYWLMQRRLSRNRFLTNRGLCAWAEGKWRSAEKLLIKGAKASPDSLINYLAAARAAQELGQYEKRDHYLRQAHGATDGVDIAVSLTQARLQILAKQFEMALATLRHVYSVNPKHVYALRLLQQVYLELQDWKQLALLIPELSNNNVLNKKEIYELTVKVYKELLLAHSNNLARLDKYWSELPPRLRFDGTLLTVYCHGLVHAGQTVLAEKMLHQAMSKNLDAKIIESYGLLITDEPGKQLQFIEKLLAKNSQNKDLLLAAARICMRQQLWGKAQNYLELLLSIDPSAIVHYELAKLMELLGNRDKALNYYRKIPQQ
jgi:HemY protein